MNDLLSSILQGIVEGLTEFLPVSSTAHILLTQELLGTDRESPFWKMFAVVIQLGAILSVVVFFRARLIGFIRSFWDAWTQTDTPPSETDRSDAHVIATKTSWGSHPLVLVLLSFVVTAIPCLIIDKLIGEHMESSLVIASSLIIGALVMIIVDFGFGKNPTTHTMETITHKQAIAIGLFQILAAAFPGTSRSMATIIGGQLFGLSRTVALEFSFFLAIPVMIAAAAFKLLQFVVKYDLPTTSEWGNLVVGFVVSFLVAYAVIAWFMSWVRQHGFIPFAIYRIALGLFLLWTIWG
ncbi:MAG: undecaprenyl-diphosphate phosphatase [Pirellula sp.]|nr:undecaprenyl-diphosphate phosphatase [Pirellula sp.]